MNQHLKPTSVNTAPTRPAMLALAALAAMFLVAASAQAGTWKSEKAHSRTELTYSAEASLLGKEVPFTIAFGGDPTSEKDVEGTLGFDLKIKDTDRLAGFPFADFEGPDAVAGAIVKATLTRSGAAPLEISSQSSGSFYDENIFSFSASEVSKKKNSGLRKLLEALGQPGAESLRLVISDPRSGGKSLEFVIPVAGREEDFQKVIDGLR